MSRQSWRLLGVLAGLSATLVALHSVQPRTLAPAASRRRAPSWRLIVRWAWIGVVAYAIAAYFIVYELIAGRTSAETNLYILQPLIWGSLAALSLLLWRHSRQESEIPHGRVLFLAGWAAAFQIAGLIGAGLVYGFGHSPFAREPWHMVQNGFYLSTLVLGIECARAYLLSRFYPRSAFLSMILISTFFALLLVPITNFYLLDSTEPGLRIAGETLLPALAISVVASYLAIHGGPLPAFLYHGGVLAFEWFSPILPAIDWTVAAFVETMAPLLALVAIRGVLQEEAASEQTEQRIDISAPWVAASAILVAILWFNSGLFGVQPAIVAGVSMEPSMHTGDLAITREIDAEDLEIGDIVRFRGESVAIMHRIIEIEDTSQGRVFVTQGDNNNTPDDPIIAAQIEGEVITTIPKVGWVSIGVSKLLNLLR